MTKQPSDVRLFWQEFRNNFHTTGAILPSGRRLSRALARYASGNASPVRVVEVGPGTGVVTREILRNMGPQDTLDLVELNDRFVARLRERLATDPDFIRHAGRVQVLHQSASALAAEQPYDLVVSGLPLNNFEAVEVESLLQTLMSVLRPGGTLSFFQYIGVRWLRTIVASGAQRDRLRGIGVAMRRVLVPHEVRRDWIWQNVPPAWVHHVRIPGRVTSGGSESDSSTDALRATLARQAG